MAENSHHFTSGIAWPFIHHQAEGRTALLCDDSVNKRAFRDENIADLFSAKLLQYSYKKVFIVVLQLGKEKFIEILKDQHPNLCCSPILCCSLRIYWCGICINVCCSFLI